MSNTATAEPKLNCFRSINQRAEQLGVHGDSLRAIIKKGEGPVVRRVSARMLGISDRDWEAWLKTRIVDPSEVGK
jgi:hypothetical protein